MLALLAAVLLIIFGGVTDRLIPLFAVGAFLAFTLSQAGMVVHWRKNNGSFHHLLINGIGAAATGVTVVVVVAAKFTQGAWIVVLLLPAAILLMVRVRRHYQLVTRETEAKGSLLRNQQPAPAHRDCAHRPMECGGPEDPALCDDAFSGCARRARGLRGRRQYCGAVAEHGRTAGARSRSACSAL